MDDWRQRLADKTWETVKATRQPIADDAIVEIDGALLKIVEGKIDGLESDLDSALEILYRRGDAEARTWLFLNYPVWARQRALS